MENFVSQENRVLQLENENAQLLHIITSLGISLPSDLNASISNLDSLSFPLPHWNHSLRSMFDNMTTMIGYWDKNLLNRYSNKSHSIWLGVSAENLHGKHITELLGENIYQLNLPFIQAVLQGIPQHFEREIPTPNGTGMRHSLSEYIPDVINGQVEGFFAHITDITNIKNAEIALRKSEERYRSVVKDQTELISRLQGDGTYIFANEVFLNFFGKSEAEMIGNKWTPLVFEEDLHHVKQELSKLNPANPVVMIENRVYSSSGEVHWMQFSNRGTFNSDGLLIEIQSVGRDISKQKNAERELKLASVVFKNTIEGILLTNANGEIISVNPAFTDISGFSSENVIGNTPRLFKSGLHDNVFYQQMWESITKQGFWHGEIWNRLKNGEIHPFIMTITAVSDSDGKILNYVGIFIDNTDNKKREEQRLIDESKYRNSLVREVHHRIKNNLQGVATFLGNMTFTHPELTEPINRTIAKVNSIAMVYGIQGSNINATIRIVELLKAIIDNNQKLQNCHISVYIPEDCLTIFIIETEAVPTALILNELIFNAIKHTKESSSISVDINYNVTQETLFINIKNKGRISKDQASQLPEFGTGLQLVKNLMPKNKMHLSWRQENDWVITTIEFSYPIIVFESDLKADADLLLENI